MMFKLQEGVAMELKQLIEQRFEQLSKSQRKVATYVVEYPGNVAMHSAAEIGSAIGVSETTVIRFCYSLGLSGYVELQKSIRGTLLVKESSLKTYQQAKLEFEQEPYIFKKVMEQDQQLIEETIKRIDGGDYEQAIDRIVGAEEVYVLGLRSSHAAASWMAYALGLVRENVKLIRIESEDVVQTLQKMNEKSVLLVVSFHRYVRETVRITELAYEQKAYIIGLTDSRLAPIQPYSHLLFPIYTLNRSTLDATTPLYSFMNALVAGVSIKEKEGFEARQKLYEQIQADFLFIEGIEKE